jgi:DUF438 domain-containing protein
MSEVIDNRAHRVKTLKEIIHGLHQGESPDAVRDKMRTLVRETDYSEIVAMEQQLMDEGTPCSEIQGMCDLHSQVTREVLVQVASKTVPPGHPVDTFRRENEALRDTIGRMQSAMAEVLGADARADVAPALLRWRTALNELMDIEKHYQRKEHLLFSCLERHGITGPSKVMWGKDDEIRTQLKALGTSLARPGAPVTEWKSLAATAGQSALSAVKEMIYKEEQILLPMALQTLTEEEWAEIWTSSPRYGWCLVDPRQGFRPPDSKVPETVRLAAADSMQLPTGNVTLQQLVAIFSTLPVDLTFVDADDRVAFFTEGPDRVFARSRAVVGRKVQHCHPPRSVDVVDRILSDFREGRQSVAEFWINFTGRFVHIRYFAVRDEQQRYLGTLEVTQDVSAIRALEGERRLLEYSETEPRP